MLDILHLRPFDYSHIQVYSLHICSLCLVPRGSLVFSVVNLVFVLVVLSISLCKCRFLDLYLVLGNISVTTKGASHGGSGGIVSYSPLLLLLEYISLGVEVIINPQ